MVEFNLTEGIGMGCGCGCGCGERGAGERRKGGGDGGGMRKVGERDDELTDFFSSFRYQGGGGLRAKIFPPRVSDDLKAIAAAARAAPRNPRATPPPPLPPSRQDRSQILPPPPTRDRDRGQIHQIISQINNTEKEESPPAPVIFFTRDGPRLAQASFFIRKGPRRRVVMINGERRVMTTYFSLPPGAVVIEEDEEELEKPLSSSSKVTRSSLKNKRKKIEEVEKKEEKSEEKKPRTTLTAAESRAYYYKRVPHDNKWKPPTSHHKLIQESHYSDPWRVLVICILLNKTTGTQVKKMLDKFFSLCPNAEAATKVSEEELMETLWPLGLYNMRTEKIKRFSREYLESEWTHVTQLYGIGKYAADAYAMFCMGAAEEVNPHDHKLVKYWQFLCEWRAQERRRQLAEGGVFF